MEQFWTIFWSAIGIIAMGLATWVTTVVTNWLNTKIKDKKMAMHASNLFNIIMNAVQAVFQDFVDTLKKSDKFDEAAQKEAREKAYKIITTQLTPELRDYITQNFGDIKEYVMNQIEAVIYQLKN